MPHNALSLLYMSSWMAGWVGVCVHDVGHWASLDAGAPVSIYFSRKIWHWQRTWAGDVGTISEHVPWFWHHCIKIIGDWVALMCLWRTIATYSYIQRYFIQEGRLWCSVSNHRRLCYRDTEIEDSFAFHKIVSLVSFRVWSFVSPPLQIVSAVTGVSPFLFRPS